MQSALNHSPWFSHGMGAADIFSGSSLMEAPNVRMTEKVVISLKD